MLVGYARVSTQDQNLDLQIDALTKAGCTKVFDDKMSGSMAVRPGLNKALDMLREGDTLVVWKLDRLGRSVKNLVDLVGALHKCRDSCDYVPVRSWPLFKARHILSTLLLSTEPQTAP